MYYTTFYVFLERAQEYTSKHLKLYEYPLETIEQTFNIVSVTK